MAIVRTVLGALLLCLHGLCLAESFALVPAEATYRVLVTGIPTGIEARVRLEADRSRPDAFHLSFLVDHALIQHLETSGFRWHPNDCHAVPDAYRFDSRGFGIRRGGEVSFDWPRSEAFGDGVRYAVPQGAVDALVLTQLARCQLSEDAGDLEFQVAEPSGLEAFRYRVLGRERLKTPAGEYTALKIERLYPERGRRTILWVAEELKYFLVRMDHIENPLIRGRMEMTSFRALPPPSPRK